MEAVYQALGITLIIAIAVVVIAMMFRDSIRKRIESGASFESSFGPTGAKLLLGPSDNEAPALPPAAQAQQLSEPLLTDAKLIKLIPPLDPKRFKTVPLPAHQPPPVYKLPDAPTGLFMLNKIPFFLQPVVDAARNLIGHQVIDIAPGHGNTATVEEVPANVQDVAAVHFLLSAGHGHVTWEGVQFLGKQIGHVELLFADNTTQQVNLILGKHIREWAFENFPGLVRDIDPALTQPAWVSYDNAHRIDYMPVSIVEGPKTLKHIRVVAQFEDKHLEKPIALPAIIISAITCERKA